MKHFETLLDYLVLLVSSSVPRLQKRVGLGAARGLHSIFTCPPRAAGTSFRTGFNLKSGAWTEIGRQDGEEGRWGTIQRGFKHRSYYNWGSGMTGRAEVGIKVDNKRNMSMFLQMHSDLLLL